jgi:hypothetical protein
MKGKPAEKIVYTDTLFKFRRNKERRLFEKARGTGRRLGRFENQRPESLQFL